MLAANQTGHSFPDAPAFANGYGGLDALVYLAAGQALTTSDQSLLTIGAYQFVPVYIIVASVSTYFFHKTGRIDADAFINGMLITAIIVASTATQCGVLR